MNYKVREEVKGSDFVLEVVSPSTWREDDEHRQPPERRGG